MRSLKGVTFARPMPCPSPPLRAPKSPDSATRPTGWHSGATPRAEPVERVDRECLPLLARLEGIELLLIAHADAAFAAQREVEGAERRAAPGFPRIDSGLTDHVEDLAIATEGNRIIAIERQVANLLAARAELGRE